MNCPNCGGLLDLNNRHCEYCDTTFTEAELYPERAVHTKEAEPQVKKTLTEQRAEELKKEKAEKKAATSQNDGSDIATGAAVMGVFGLFSGIRRFFRELKRTVCFILLIALEIGFGYILLSGVFSNVMESEIKNFVLQNGIILLNALLAGLISRIGRIRVGTVLVGIINCLAVIWAFIYPLFSADFEGVGAKYVAVLAIIEMAVIALSVLFAHLIYRR